MRVRMRGGVGPELRVECRWRRDTVVFSWLAPSPAVAAASAVQRCFARSTASNTALLASGQHSPTLLNAFQVLVSCTQKE